MDESILAKPNLALTSLTKPNLTFVYNYQMSLWWTEVALSVCAIRTNLFWTFFDVDLSLDEVSLFDEVSFFDDVSFVSLFDEVSFFVDVSFVSLLDEMSFFAEVSFFDEVSLFVDVSFVSLFDELSLFDDELSLQRWNKDQVRSRDTVSKKLSQGENSIWMTVREWPDSRSISFHVLASQRNTWNEKGETFLALVRLSWERLLG